MHLMSIPARAAMTKPLLLSSSVTNLRKSETLEILPRSGMDDRIKLD